MSAKITVNNNGSLRIEGEIELFDSNGNKFDLGGREKIGFCRCGESKNKPFCDGTHREINFQSVCEARALPPIEKRFKKMC